MTLPATPFRKDHTLTGSIVPLLYDWKIEDDSHLLVTLVNTSVSPNVETTLIIGTDYTVTGVGNDGGGNVVPTSGHTAGWKIAITSNVPYEQDTDFTNQNSVLPEEAESMADKLGRQIKQIVEVLSRCVKTTVGGGVQPDDLLDAINDAVTLSGTNAAQTSADVVTTGNNAAAAAAAAAMLPLNNFSATSPPTVNDDIGNGYSIGSRWVDTTGDLEAWVCADATLGAAQWLATTLTIDDLGSLAVLNEVAYANIAAAALATAASDVIAGTANKLVTAAGMKAAAPNTVLQVVQSETTASTGITATIPIDNTIPQNTEGTELLTVTITPKESNSKIRLRAVVQGGNSTSAYNAGAVFKDSDANAIGVGFNGNGGGVGTPLVIDFFVNATNTTARTYKLRVGTQAGTWTINGNASVGALFNGTCKSTFTAEEISQ